MQKNVAKEMIQIPKDEYEMLRENYKTVKRQKLLFTIDEASKHLKAGKIKRVSIDEVIDSI